MPVGPADEVLVSNITDLVDLLRAGTLGEAGTELRDEKRKAETVSVLGSLSNSLLVPFEALVSVSDLGLTSGALTRAELATVSVVVEDVEVRADLTTRWGLESNRED